MRFISQGDDSLTKQLFDRLIQRRNIYVTAATCHKRMVIRFVICSEFSREDDIHFAWNEISELTTELLPMKSLAIKIQICESESFDQADDEIAIKFNEKQKRKKIPKRCR